MTPSLALRVTDGSKELIVVDNVNPYGDCPLVTHTPYCLKPYTFLLCPDTQHGNAK